MAGQHTANSKMALSLLQHGTSPQQNVTGSFTTGMNTQNLTAGSTIVVGITTYLPGTVSNVSDPTNGNYTQIISSSNSPTFSFLYYFPNNAITGGNVTITINIGAGFAQACCCEIGGVATASLDGTGASGTTSGTTPTTGSFSTAQANEIVIAYAGSTGGFGSGCTYSAQSGYTITDQNNGSSSSSAQGMQYNIFSSIQTGITTNLVSSQSGAQNIVAAAFKAVAAGGLLPLRMLMGVGT
jgi:hypothetical protein